MNSPVYMDYNASAPIRPQAAVAAGAALQMGGNPSSVHGFGRAARRVMEDAREQVAASIRAAAREIVFTSGATEANNLALAGSGRARRLVSAIEHDSLRAASELELIPVNAAGVVDLGALEDLLAADSRPALISLMLANNETGVLQPVAEAAELAHRHGALLLCDAVQALGRLPVDVAALGVDLLSLSGHKIGGPAGVGALYVRSGLDLAPALSGGGQERGRRAGTENLAGIAGFGAAAAVAVGELADVRRVADLRDALEARIHAARPEALIFGRDAARLANTTCVALAGVPAETQVMVLDLAGVAVSAGAACSSGKLRPSTVLRAMGVAPEIAGSAIRVSLGWRSEAGDIDRFIGAWSGISAKASATRELAA
jgi:cysteine desulfurase